MYMCIYMYIYVCTYTHFNCFLFVCFFQFNCFAYGCCLCFDMSVCCFIIFEEPDAHYLAYREIIFCFAIFLISLLPLRVHLNIFERNIYSIQILKMILKNSTKFYIFYVILCILVYICQRICIRMQVYTERRGQNIYLSTYIKLQFKHRTFLLSSSNSCRISVFCSYNI